MRFFLIGFMGTGKTYWGQRWASAFQLNFFDLDVEIEKSEGKSVTEIFEKMGEAYFRKLEKKILKSFFEKDNFILACGGGTPAYFNNMKLMNKKGISIFLKTDISETVHRLMLEKETRPLIKNFSDEESLKNFIQQKMNERMPYYLKAMYHFKTAFLSHENFKKIITKHA